MKIPYFVSNLIYKVKPELENFKQLQQKQIKRKYFKDLTINTIKSVDNYNQKQQLKQKPYRKYSFYIGSNNSSHEVEINKIQQLFNKHFEAFTIKNTLGYYNNDPEKSVIVELYDKEKSLKFIKWFSNDLKLELKQNSILLVIEKPRVDFI